MTKTIRTKLWEVFLEASEACTSLRWELRGIQNELEKWREHDNFEIILKYFSQHSHIADREALIWRLKEMIRSLDNSKEFYNDYWGDTKEGLSFPEEKKGRRIK